ncbi:hypothetical protein Ahy_A04g019084 [Arachis hypogaea]|uniref:Uncharacterized protein n=1 Tax=Arachis hypogaea TaxID=3818 RepID=A0A445DF97_ARAHY|nr:hypothetical protein Ahy_A04g019084 [Arachis hypogaea]
MGPLPPPPPPISTPHPLCNSSLLVNSETPGSSSTSPLSETASVPNSVTKERLVPDGKTSWLPFHLGSQKITEIIKKQYDKLYKKFGDVPLPTKKLWFKEWKGHFLIDDDDDEFFRRAFKYRTSKRFSQMMSDIREDVDRIHEWLISTYKKVLERNQNFVPDLREQIYNLNEELFQRVTQQTNEHISKLLDTCLAPLEKTQKKLEKLERAIGKGKKEKLKQKRWNETYVSYYEKVRASSNSSAVPLPPPPPPPSMSSDEDYDDDEDEDDTEDYS